MLFEIGISDAGRIVTMEASEEMKRRGKRTLNQEKADENEKIERMMHDGWNVVMMRVTHRAC